MKVLHFLQPEVGHLKPYEPGKPIEYVAREFGLDAKAVAKLASNENALGPSPRAQEAIRRWADQVHLYPDGGGYDLKHRLAGKYELKPEEIILGNG
ncbi:MAG: histidinol-phosphate transaminase, partial [Lentisphaerae bacterium]